MNKLRTLATGKSGQIGSHLSDEIESIEGDLLNCEWKVKNDFLNVRTVIHLAGVVGNHNVNKDKEFAEKVNVIATEKLARFVFENTDARFLHISSSHVYKPTKDLINEKSEVLPLHEYGKQKARAEERLLKVFSSEPSRLKIVRVFSVLNLKMPQGTLGWAMERLLNQNLRFADDVRDFLTASQIASIIEKLANLEFDEQTVNICTGVPTSIRDAAHFLLGRGGEIDQYLSPGYSEVPKIVGDPNVLKVAMGHNYDSLRWSYLP